MRLIADKQIGTISHYYDKLGVGIINLTSGTINLGDTIKIVNKDDEFEQKVESMQVEHKEVKSIKKGDDAGIKLDKAVKAGAKIYKK